MGSIVEFQRPDGKALQHYLADAAQVLMPATQYDPVWAQQA